jgi:putative transposase
MHVGGSSTRDISKFIERVYSASLGRDAISRLTDVAQGVIDKWKNRPLAREYAVSFLDATYVNLRRGDVRSEPVYAAMGLLPNGDRQILGFTMFGSEGESAGAWHEYLLRLKERGVKTVKVFVTNNLRGLTETTARIFPESQHQLCVVHHVRNCLRDTRVSDKAELAQDMKTIYRVDNLRVAKKNYEVFRAKWGKRNPNAVRRWEANLHHLLILYNFDLGLRPYV